MQKELLNIGKKVEKEELQGLFESDEGDIELIYGRIGNGKTTEAVRRMLNTLSNGGVVYSNIKLDLSSFIFDDRLSFSRSIFNFLLFRKRFFSFDKSNFHYFNPDDYEPAEMVDFLASLTDCEIYYDEGHWLLDSYEGTKISKSRRKLILETRHFNRKIVLITQRPTAIAVSARGNVNRFWQCKKLLSWPLLVLRVMEFQDMTFETVDETKPASNHLYFINTRVFTAFNTHFLRGGVKRSQEVYFSAYDLKFKERAIVFYKNFLLWLKPKKKILKQVDFEKVQQITQESMPF